MLDVGYTQNFSHLGRFIMRIIVEAAYIRRVVNQQTLLKPKICLEYLLQRVAQQKLIVNHA